MTFAMDIVCCSMTSWIAVLSVSIILSNSSMQQTPWSANTRAPPSKIISYVTGSFMTAAVRPTPDEPRPVVYWPGKQNTWSFHQIKNGCKKRERKYLFQILCETQASTLMVVRLSGTTKLPNRTSKTTCLVVRCVKSYFRWFLATKYHWKYAFRRMISRYFGALRGRKKHHSLKQLCQYLTSGP